jgi:hypothetical protein
MAAKKKNKTRSTATRPKKVRGGIRKAKTSKKPAAKQPPRTRAGSKAKGKKSKKRRSVNAESELKREFQSRQVADRSRGLARQSEDLKGLSRSEQADSESVDELVQEGNLFEAGAVAGVEEADAADEKEVHTRELPEDDVPEEYLDKD